MSYSFYDATVSMAKSALNALDGMLVEAEKCPNSASFPTSRLIEDMKPLSFQVHYATFQCEYIALILLEEDEQYKEPEDNLNTFEQMHERIVKVLKKLDQVNKEEADGKAEKMKEIKIRDQSRLVPFKAIIGQQKMPNVYFHVNMSYAILRKEGVPLEKRHWSRPFVSEYV